MPASAPEIIGAPHLSLTPDGRTPGISRRIWSDVSSLAELVKRPDFPDGKVSESGGVIVLDGSSHIELPGDSMLLREVVISSRIRWTGEAGERLFETAGMPGDVIYFSPSQNGKSRLVISHNGKTCEVSAPPVPRDIWTDITISLREGRAIVAIAGQATASQPCAITPLDLDVTKFLLGRGFTGKIEHFTVSHPR